MKLKYTTYLFFLCFIFNSTYTLHAQLVVNPNSNPSALVNNIVAPGIVVSNISLNCDGRASGTFTANGTNLGISSGIILSTGRVIDAIGPNNSGGNQVSSNGCFSQGTTSNFYDPQITGIVPEAKYDGCVLEFDLKPICNTININYVFGSEEYPEFVCSKYNDIFGFFISGPNPSGGNYSNLNIARIQGTTTPVSINSINSGSTGSSVTSSNTSSNCILNNTGYYVNNNNGGSLQYDGFTVPLVAAANVIPCATYHLKLAIADAGDCEYDSGVFLTYHGITCPQAQIPAVAATVNDVNCVSDGSAAVNVTNYSGATTYSWQPGGQTTSAINNLTPGIYTCTLNFNQPCPFSQEVKVTVKGDNALKVVPSSVNAYCGNATGTATVQVSGGIPPYVSYNWSTQPPQTTATATQLIPGNYTISVMDSRNCLVTKSVTVGNTVPNITIKDSVLNTTCKQINGQIYITNVSGGTTPYTFSWNTTPVQNTQNITNLPVGNYMLTVTDAQNCKASKVIPLVNYGYLPLDTAYKNERCLLKNGFAKVIVLNGVPPYTYSWSHNPALNSPEATNIGAGHYVVKVTDAVGCTNKDSVDIININDIFNGVIYTTPTEPEVNVPFQLIISNPPLWDLNYVILPDKRSSTDPINTLLYEAYGDYTATFYVTSKNGCKDSIPYTFFVKDFMTIYIPNAFTPNNDDLNNTWNVYGTLVKRIKIYVFDRWGMKIFESDSLGRGWDGTYKGKQAQQDVYVYKVEAEDFFYKTFVYTGTISLIR